MPYSTTMPYRSNFTEEQITRVLLAVAAHAGSISAAHKSITTAEDGFSVTTGTISHWVKITHADRYLELRDRYREQIEKQLADRQTDAAALGTEVVALGLERAKRRLDGGLDQDPSRTAANAATAVDKMTRTSLVLQNRPSVIKQERNLEETLRSLAAKGILRFPEGEVQEDDRSATTAIGDGTAPRADE